MILVDTSVWVDHLRNGNHRLQALLERNEVLIHAFVIGELSCGTLKKRAEVLGLLQALPRAMPATDEEAMALVERRRLWGRGAGWVDIHLLASAILSHARLLTLDKRLSALTDELDAQM